jgi:preprotein translocase subunit YajC
MAPAGQTGTPQTSGLVQTLFMLVPMILIFYFLIIRPQSKRSKEHQAFLNGLKKGDDVVTAGGLLGRIVGVSDQVVTLEVGDKLRVRVLRSQISAYHKAEGGDVATQG